MSDLPKSLHCYVSGRVQGVWFRAWVREQAQDLGLTGWTRNLPDSRVEVLAQGPEDALAELTARLHAGSKLSRVDSVACSRNNSEPIHEEFTIRH